MEEREQRPRNENRVSNLWTRNTKYHCGNFHCRKWMQTDQTYMPPPPKTNTSIININIRPITGIFSISFRYQLK